MLGAGVAQAELVEYRDYDADARTFTNAVRECTLVTSETRVMEDGWYAVRGEVKFQKNYNLVVSNAAHLVLCDGASLTIEMGTFGADAPGVDLSPGFPLVIYGQEANSGRLEAQGGFYSAGIGGGPRSAGGTLTINGGTVTAIGGELAAGIGGGEGGAGGVLTINGGCVDARAGSQNAEDFGHGNGADDSGTIVISGGIFAKYVKMEWCLDHVGCIANPDPETCDAYPYAAVFAWMATTGPHPYVDVLWTCGDGSVTNVAAKEYFNVLPGTENVRVMFRLNDARFVLDSDATVADIGAMTGDVTFGDGKDRPLPYAAYAYLDWDAGNGEMTNALARTLDVTPLSADSRNMENGWYSVTNKVVIPNGANLDVNGAAHLILCDGASLQVTEPDHLYAAVKIDMGDKLTVYGQTLGSGVLKAQGGEWGAGIGGSDMNGSGEVTINGGTVTATGGSRGGAGIGGSADSRVSKVTVNGGTVTATAGSGGSGIGGGSGGEVTINGGTVTATGRVGIGGDTEDGYKVTITGGRIRAQGSADGADIAEDVAISGGVFARQIKDEWCAGRFWPAANPDPTTSKDYPYTVLSVATVTIGAHPYVSAAWTSGDGKVTNAIDGTSFKVLPRDVTDLRVVFAAESGYVLDGVGEVFLGTVTDDVVFGVGNEYKVPQARFSEEEIPYLDWNGSEMTNAFVSSRECLPVSSQTRMLEAGWYAVRGEVVLDPATNLTVHGDVHLILCDWASLTVADSPSDSPAINITEGNTLTIHGQSAGTGRLDVRGRGDSATIGCICGGVYGELTIDGGLVTVAKNADNVYGAGIGCTLTVNGGDVMASGAWDGAGIGGCKNGAGVAVTVNGGVVLAQGGGSAAGIGGGSGGSGGSLAINGGTVTAIGGDAWYQGKFGGAGIGGGENGDGGVVTIRGGWVTAIGVGGAEDIGHGGHGECEVGSGKTEIMGGYLWRKPDDAWIATGCQAVENTDESTKAGYPWTVKGNASVTINEIRMLDPWNVARGTITIDYTLAGLEVSTPYKLVLDISAGGRTASVTYAATRRFDGRQTVLTNDTAVLFGETVADKDATVMVRLIAMRRIPGVQLWDNGPFFAESNLGVTNPEDYGSLYDFHDAQAAVSGVWHTPMKDELQGLLSHCTIAWDNEKKGWNFSGIGSYSSNSIFLPAAGKSTTRDGAGSIGYYWSTSIADERNGYHLYLDHNKGEADCRTTDIYGVFNAMSVRQVRSASSPSWEESAEVTDKMTFMLGMTTVALPTGMTGYGYVVSNLTSGTEIAVSDDGRCIMPLGAKVGVYAVPEAGYVIVGTNPYVIEQVTLDTTIDESVLPKVSPTVVINEVKSIDTWDGEKGPVAIDYTLAGLNTNLEYKVAFEIMAGEQAVSVTNAAARRFDGRQTVVTNDTAALFGEEVVTDDAVMRLSLIALKPKVSESSECEEVVESISEKPFLLGMTEVVLPTEMIVYDYAVSNLTDAAEIAPRVEGRYALPLGARVAVYAMPEAGYVIVGTNPYVIEKVTSDTTIDADILPRVSPTVILRNVETFGPWDGRKGVVAVDYSLAGLEADRWYKVAFEITADGRTAGVTNHAAKLPEGKQELKLIETVPLFGTEIVDKDAVLKLSLIAVNPIPEGQLWANGPVWAESNLGESEVADHPEYGALYDFDNAINAASELGDGWRLPTGDELAKLIDTSDASVCTRKWDDDRKGWTFTGAGTYSSNSIFLPAAGFDTSGSRYQPGLDGVYRSSSSDSPSAARILLFDRNEIAAVDYARSVGGSVRVVKDVGSGSETVKSTDEAVFRLGPKEVYYRDYDPETGTFTNASRRCTLVTSGTRLLSGGWYAVEGALDFPRNAGLWVSGNVHLILCDGASLTITNWHNQCAAVTVTGINRLTVYGQLDGSGRLTVSGGANNAGIGGYSGTSGSIYEREDPEDCGTVTINGGTVTATGGMYGAGIGGSCDADGGKVTINGGTVTATGGYGAAGIGCAFRRMRCTVTVTDGQVTARKGGDSSSADDIGYGECTGMGKREGANIKLSGGLFARRPKDEWTIQSCRVVPNMDDATSESYPWRIVASNAVVSPEYPLGPYETAAEATNVMASAEFAPDSDVAVELGIGSAALVDYCSKFGLDVVQISDGKWSVAALLEPEPWTNVVLSAQSATRQVPVAEIAVLGTGAWTNVRVEGCVPGFYYTLYGADDLIAGTIDVFGPRLCGADGKVEFDCVVKPSDAAGFFRVGVSETK